MNKITLSLLFAFVCALPKAYSQSPAKFPGAGKGSNVTSLKNSDDGKNLATKWKAGPSSMPGGIEAFEENKGEFVNPLNGWNIAYGCSNQGIKIYFTEKGIVYQIQEVIQLKDDEKLAEKEEAEKEQETKTKVVMHNVSMEWEGANPNPTITAENITPFYFGALDPTDPHKAINHINGYRKITYHELYPGIDVEFSFAKGAVKYAIKVRSGADLSKYKMLYAGFKKLKIDEAGNLVMATPVAAITDHAPATYENGKPIASAFIKTGENEVSFSVNQSKMGSALVIDPTLTVTWYVHPTSIAYRPSDIGMDQFSNTDVLGYDASGAEYVQQYSPTGALNWTYTLTQYGTSSTLGALTVDRAGNSYIVSPFSFSNAAGHQYALISLNVSGVLNYFNDNNTSTQIFEIWNLAYSCSYDMIVQAGSPAILESQLSTINAANGNLGSVVISTTIGEIYSGCFGPNGYYYGLSANTSFSGNAQNDQLNCYNISSGTPVLLWNMNSDYNFDDYEFKGINSIGNNAMAAGCSYLYTSSGDSVHQRSLTNGSVINRVALPGGSRAVKKVNSGLAADAECGNVYAGSYYAVYAYDQNLNSLASYTTLPGIVLGVAYDNGLVSACGGQVTSSTDTAFVIQFDALPCASQLSVVGTTSTCYKPNGTATANPSFCGAPYTYFWQPSGQTSQTATGLSAGTYTVTVSPQGGCVTVSDTITIGTTPSFTIVPTVKDTLHCLENISVTITGGTPPFTYLWGNGNTTTSIKEVSYGNYVISVTDSGGGCTLTDTIQAKGGAISLIVPTPARCSVANSGSATVNVTGGHPPFTYYWSNGETTATDTDLVTGTYTITVTDSNGCTFKDSVNIVTYPKPIVTALPILDSACSGVGVPISAAGGYTYVWNPGYGLSCSTCQSATATPSVTTTYTVTGTDTNGCSNTATVTVKVLPGPLPIITGKDTICIGTRDTLTVTGGTTYIWTNNGSTNDYLRPAPTVTTTFTVEAFKGGCQKDTTFTIHVVPVPTASVVPSKDSVCSGDSLTLFGSGGTTYKWSPGGATSSTIHVNPTTTTTYTLYTFGGTCKDSTTIKVNTLSLSTASISPNDTICPKGTATLTVTGTGGNVTYKWSNGATTSVITVSDTATTTYTATVFGRCDTINKMVSVVVEPLATPSFTGTTDWKCHGQKDTIKISGGCAYVWDNGTTKTSYITGDINADSTIYVTVKNCFGCPVKDSFKVTMRVQPFITFTSVTICSGECVTLDPKIVSNPAATYVWTNNGTTTDTLTVCPTSDSTFTLTANNGCPASKSTSVTVFTPTLFACCDTTITKGDTAKLSANSTSNHYIWSPPTGLNCDTCANVKATPTVTTTYTVTGTDGNGCTDTRVLTVTVDIPCLDFKVPNVITPNDPGPQGLNNMFYMKTENITNWSVIIYDRWGKEMFKTTDPTVFWTGTTEGGDKASDGVYYYIITGTCQNNTYKKDGFVQLIR